MRPLFLGLKADTIELNKRRSVYVEEIERLKFSYNKISKKVEIIGKSYMNPKTGIITLPEYNKKKPPARIDRLLDRMKKQEKAFAAGRKCRLTFFGFELSLQERAVVHLQRVFRGSRPRRAQILARLRMSRMRELARLFLTVHPLPKIQKTMIRIVKSFHKAERFRINNASRVLSKNLRFHAKRMQTYRWCIKQLDARIAIHKKQVWASHVIQSRYRKRMRYKSTLQQLMKYSNLKLEDERIALMGEQDGQRHRAANVLQKPVPGYLKRKHEYIENLWPHLHPKLGKHLLCFDLTLEAHAVLRGLQQASWKEKEALQIDRINRMRLENTSRFFTASPSLRKHKAFELAPDPFKPEPLPPTVLSVTGTFPVVGAPRPDDFDRYVRLTTWNFWLEIEVLNKEYWIPTIKAEDEEDFTVARGFLKWYIGESNPVRRHILPKYPVSGHSRARIKKLEEACQSYKFDGFNAKKESDLLPKAYRFVWIPLEALCEGCWTFKNETPNGWCTECDLPPAYTRVVKKQPSKMRNRFHLTRSHKCIRAEIDLFMVHAVFRVNTPPEHPSRRQPFFQVWKSAVKGAKKHTFALKRWGCTTVGDLKSCPLLDIGIPARLALMIRKLLWHIDSVLNWMIDLCPLRPSLVPPKTLVTEDGWDPREDDEDTNMNGRSLRPFTAPANLRPQKKGPRGALKSAKRRSRKERPESSPAISPGRRSPFKTKRGKSKRRKRKRKARSAKRAIRVPSIETAPPNIVVESNSISEEILGSYNSPIRVKPISSNHAVGIRPGTSLGLERIRTERPGNMPSEPFSNSLRPGTAPMKLDDPKKRRPRSSRPRSQQQNRRNRAQSAVRRIRRFPPSRDASLPPRPGSVGNVSPIRDRSHVRTPSSGRRSRNSSRGEKRTVTTPSKYARPTTAPIWRVDGNAGRGGLA